MELDAILALWINQLVDLKVDVGILLRDPLIDGFKRDFGVESPTRTDFNTAGSQLTKDQLDDSLAHEELLPM